MIQFIIHELLFHHRHSIIPYTVVVAWRRCAYISVYSICALATHHAHTHAFERNYASWISVTMALWRCVTLKERGCNNNNSVIMSVILFYFGGILAWFMCKMLSQFTTSPPIAHRCLHSEQILEMFKQMTRMIISPLSLSSLSSLSSCLLCLTDIHLSINKIQALGIQFEIRVAWYTFQMLTVLLELKENNISQLFG